MGGRELYAGAQSLASLRERSIAVANRISDRDFLGVHVFPAHQRSPFISATQTFEAFFRFQTGRAAILNSLNCYSAPRPRLLGLILANSEDNAFIEVATSKSVHAWPAPCARMKRISSPWPRHIAAAFE